MPAPPRNASAAQALSILIRRPGLGRADTRHATLAACAPGGGIRGVFKVRTDFMTQWSPRRRSNSTWMIRRAEKRLPAQRSRRRTGLILHQKGTWLHSMALRRPDPGAKAFSVRVRQE